MRGTTAPSQQGAPLLPYTFAPVRLSVVLLSFVASPALLLSAFALLLSFALLLLLSAFASLLAVSLLQPAVLA